MYVYVYVFVAFFAFTVLLMSIMHVQKPLSELNPVLYNYKNRNHTGCNDKEAEAKRLNLGKPMTQSRNSV